MSWSELQEVFSRLPDWIWAAGMLFLVFLAVICVYWLVYQCVKLPQPK